MICCLQASFLKPRGRRKINCRGRQMFVEKKTNLFTFFFCLFFYIKLSARVIICLETDYLSIIFLTVSSDWTLTHTKIQLFLYFVTFRLKLQVLRLLTCSSQADGSPGNISCGPWTWHEMQTIYLIYPTFQILGYSVTLTRICWLGQLTFSQSASRTRQLGQLGGFEEWNESTTAGQDTFCNVCYLTELACLFCKAMKISLSSSAT